MQKDLVTMAKSVVQSISKNIRNYFNDLPPVDFVKILADEYNTTEDTIKKDPHYFGLNALEYRNSDTGKIEDIVIYGTDGSGGIYCKSEGYDPEEFMIELRELACVEDEIYLVEMVVNALLEEKTVKFHE